MTTDAYDPIRKRLLVCERRCDECLADLDLGARMIAVVSRPFHDANAVAEFRDMLGAAVES